MRKLFCLLLLLSVTLTGHAQFTFNPDGLQLQFTERWMRYAKGRSMLPALPERCYLEIWIKPLSMVKDGDVVFFRYYDGRSVAHRVFFIDGRMHAKGDHNRFPDMDRETGLPLCIENRYVGVVTGYATVDRPDVILPVEPLYDYDDTQFEVMDPQLKNHQPLKTSLIP